MSIIMHMKRTTIAADEDLLLALRGVAQRRGLSMSEAVREAIAAYVVGQRASKRRPSFIGSGASGGRLRVSERDEALLFQEDAPKRR